MSVVRYNTLEYVKYFNNINTYRDLSNMLSNIFPYLVNKEVSLVNEDGSYKTHQEVLTEIFNKILTSMDADTIAIMQLQIEGTIYRLSDLILGIHEYIKSSTNISTFSIYYEQNYLIKPDIQFNKPLNSLSPEELLQMKQKMIEFNQNTQHKYSLKKSILTFGNSESDLGEYSEVKEIPRTIKNYLSGNLSVNPIVLTQYYMLSELFFIFTQEIPEDTEIDFEYTVQDIFVTLLKGAEQFILEYAKFGEYIELGDIIRYTGNSTYVLDKEFLPFMLNRMELQNPIKEVIETAIQTSNDSLDEVKKFHRIDIERYNPIDYDMFTMPFAEHQTLFNKTMAFYTEVHDLFKNYTRTKNNIETQLLLYKELFNDETINEELKEEPLSDIEKAEIIKKLNSIKFIYQQILDNPPSEHTPLEIIEQVMFDDIKSEKEQVIPSTLAELGFTKPYIENRINKKFLPNYEKEYFDILLKDEYHEDFVSIFKEVFDIYIQDTNEAISIDTIDTLISNIQ